MYRDKGERKMSWEVLGKKALFYKQMAIAATTVPNEWFFHLGVDGWHN
jgi:hypothetical protein